MSRDKQIKEMARIIANANGNEQDVAYYIPDATDLYNADYRKASELAEEIFAEIKELLNVQAKIVCKTRGEYRETDKPMLSFIAELDGRLYSLRVVEEQLAELKKKYTKSENNNDKEKNIERPYLNDFCEKCIYHYLLGGDEARCSKIHLGMSSVMCAQVVSCDKYTPQKKYKEEGK